MLYHAANVNVANGFRPTCPSYISLIRFWCIPLCNIKRASVQQETPFMCACNGEKFVYWMYHLRASP